MNSSQDVIYGWAVPGATVKVHAHRSVYKGNRYRCKWKMVDTYRSRKRKYYSRSATKRSWETMVRLVKNDNTATTSISETQVSTK